MKVVQLTTVHPVHDTRIFVKQCPTLSKAGYDVTLLACADEHVKSEAFTITVMPRPSNRSARMLFGSTWMLKTALKSRASIYHFHDPELLVVGLVLRALGKTVIYDVHEDYSETIRIRHWIPKALRPLIARCFDAFERVAAKLMSANVAATPAIARRLPKRNTVVVQNFPVVEEFQGISLDDYELRPPHLAYAGIISHERGVLELVRSLPLIAKEVPSVRLTLAGSFGNERIEAELRSEPGWALVDFQGWVNRRELVACLGRARAGMVAFHPVGNFVEAFPVKMFEYMAAGLPVIASDFPLNRQLVRDRDCGLLVDPHSPQDVASAAIRLLSDTALAKQRGMNGRRAVIDEFSWDSQRKKLLALYSSLVEAS